MGQTKVGWLQAGLYFVIAGYLNSKRFSHLHSHNYQQLYFDVGRPLSTFRFVQNKSGGCSLRGGRLIYVLYDNITKPSSDF